MGADGPTSRGGGEVYDNTQVKPARPGQCPTCRSDDAKYRTMLNQLGANQCCDEWHTTPTTRYLLGPYEDEAPFALMSLEAAIDHLKAFFHEQDGGDEAHFRIIELTDAEVEAIPEL